MIWRYGVGIVCVLGCVIALPYTAFAQEEDGRLHLIVTPIIDLVIEPGETVNAPLRIQNAGNQTERLRVGVMKFRAHDLTGRPQILDPEPEDEFIHWVSFSEDEFDIDPGEWKTVMATFDVPEHAAFGYYYAITFARADIPQTQEELEAAIHGAAAVLVLVEVRVPHAIRSVEVLEFTTDRPWYEFLPVRFSVTLANRGNVHVAPTGNIFVKRNEGPDISILEVNRHAGFILPDSGRQFHAVWDEGFPMYEEQLEDGKVALDEDGRKITKLEWDFREAHKFRWGKYTANLLMVYDDGQRDIPISATTSFWIIPWRIILVAVGVVLFVVIGLHSTGRGIMRRIRKFFPKKRVTSKQGMSPQEPRSPRHPNGTMKLVFALSLIPLTWFVSGIFSSVHAHGLSLTPALQEIELLPDQSEARFELTFVNHENTAYTLRFFSVDFGKLSEAVGIAFLDMDIDQLEREYGLASWIRLPSETITIDPQGRHVVEAAVINQESLSPGGHYAAIMARIESAESHDEEQQTSVDVRGSMAALLFVKKLGGERYSVGLGEVTMSPTLLNMPNTTTLLFENTGNIHAVPRGVVEIKDWRGRIVRRGTINQESLLVLPDNSRRMTVRMNPLDTTILPGLYYATIQYRYDGRDEFTVLQKPFVYIGWHTFAMVVLVVTAAGIYVLKKRSP